METTLAPTISATTPADLLADKLFEKIPVDNRYNKCEYLKVPPQGGDVSGQTILYKLTAMREPYFYIMQVRNIYSVCTYVRLSCIVPFDLGHGARHGTKDLQTGRDPS